MLNQFTQKVELYTWNPLIKVFVMRLENITVIVQEFQYICFTSAQSVLPLGVNLQPA